MLQQLTDRSLITGSNRNTNLNQYQKPSDLESSSNKKENLKLSNLKKKTNLQKINNYMKRIDNQKKPKDSQNDKIQNFSFQQHDFTGLKVSDKKRNINEQTFFGDFKDESDQKVEEFGEIDDELNILSKQIMEIENEDFSEFEQNMKNEEIYLEFDELMELSRDLKEIETQEENKKIKILKQQTNKNIQQRQADSYCSSVFQNLMENQMLDISSLSQSLDGSNFDQVLLNDMPSQIIMQDHSNDQIYDQNDQSSFIFQNCQKNDMYQRNQLQNFQKLFSNAVKKFDFQNQKQQDNKQQDLKSNQQNMKIVKNIIKEENDQNQYINITQEEQLESGPQIAKNIDINGSCTLRTFRQNSNDIKSQQKINKSEQTTKSKNINEEECGTEIEEEMEYYEGIHLGEMENEPNTVIKYEQQSSEQQLNTEEVGVFNNQDGFTQYHITQGNSVLIRSNFLSSSQSHSNVFTTHLQNNLYTSKMTAVQSSIKNNKESSIASAASNHLIQEQTLTNLKNTQNLQVANKITENSQLVQLNELDQQINTDDYKIDIKENQIKLDELKNHLNKVLINFREQKDQLIILQPKQKKQEGQQTIIIENEKVDQNQIINRNHEKSCEFQETIREENEDIKTENHEELEQVNSLQNFGNILRQNINTRLPRLEANEEVFSSTNSFRNSTSQDQSCQSNQFVSPNIQVQQLSQQNFENLDQNSPIYYEYNDQLNQSAPENESIKKQSFQNIREFIKNPEMQQQSKKEQLQKLLLENQKIMAIMQAKNNLIQNQGQLSQQYLSDTQRVSKTLLNQMITRKEMNKQKNKTSKQVQQEEQIRECLSKRTSNLNQPKNAYNISFSLNNSRATVQSTCALKKINRTSILGKHKFKSIDHSSHSIHQKKIIFNDQHKFTQFDNTQQIQSNQNDKGNGFSQGLQNNFYDKQSQNDQILNTQQSNSNVIEHPIRKNIQQENRKNKISNNIKMMKTQFVDSENMSYLNETKKQGKLSQTSQNISHKNLINLSQKNNHIIQSTVNADMRKIGFPVPIFNRDCANIDNSNICKIDLISKNEQIHMSKARRTTTAEIKIKNQKKRVGQNKTTTEWHSNGFGAQQLAGMQKRQNDSVSRTHRKIKQQNIAVQKSQANLIYLKSKSNAVLDNETLLQNQNRKRSPKIKNSLHTLNKNSSNEISNSRFSKNKTQKSISFLKKKISLGQMMMFNINQDGKNGFSASYQDHGCNYRNNINRFSSNISSNDFNIQQGEFNCKIFKQLSTANNLENQDNRNEIYPQHENLNKQKVNYDQNKKLLKVNHQSSSSFSQAIIQTKSNKILNNFGIQQLSASAEIRRQINENKDFPSSYNSINPIQNLQMNNIQQQQAFLFSPNNFNNDKILLQNEGMFSIKKSQFENLKALTNKTKNKSILKNQNLLSSETVEIQENKKMQIKSQKKNSIQLTQINEFSPNRNINQKTWRDSSQLKKQKQSQKQQQNQKEGGLSSSLYMMTDHHNSKLLNSAGKSGAKKMGSFKIKNRQQNAPNNQIIASAIIQDHQHQYIQNGNEFQNEPMNCFTTLQIQKYRQLLEQQNQQHQLQLQKHESRKGPPNISTSHRSSQSIHKFNKQSSKNRKNKNVNQTDNQNEMKKKKNSKTLNNQQEMQKNLRNQLNSNIISPSQSLYLQQQASNMQEMQENINSNNVPFIQITDNQSSYLDESVQQANPFQKQKFYKQMKNYLGSNATNQFKSNDLVASLKYSQEFQQ